MTRPFGLGDLGLLWGLRGRGIVLDMQRALLWRPRPLQTALTGLFPSPRPSPSLTYVCRGQETNSRGFIQVLTCPERHEWQVIHLAPWARSEDLESGTGWVSALMDLCALAGEWGAWRIRAGVAAGGPEEEAFRQAGYAVYAREEIHRLLDPHPGDGPAGGLRPLTPQDAWPLSQLVSQVVPPAVQHAEGMTVSGTAVPILTRLGVAHEQGYVLERGPELDAYAGLSRSDQAAWARILLHPEARERAGDVLRHLTAMASPGPALYCAVREYQAGLRSVLAAMGFEFVGVQVWLVKHTTRPLECRRHRHVAALEKRTEPATTPLHSAKDQGVTPCSWMAREHCVYEYRRTDGYAIGSN